MLTGALQEAAVVGEGDLPPAVHHIGRNHGILCGLDKLTRLHPAVIEIVVAERHGIEPEQVRDFKNR